MSRILTIAIVVGEASGDLLGASLIRAIRTIHPEVRFEGIGGPRMIEAGFESIYPMDRLSVMGFVEPMKRLPELFGIRTTLVRRFLLTQPDLYIGIDSPDFNLQVEAPLKRAGIPVAHYVSPSVWAWRQGRIRTIRRSADLMLCLLPFEVEFYKSNKMPAVFVGHPMADEISRFARDQIDRSILAGYASSGANLVALLPGSRRAEIEAMAPVFFTVARRVHERWPETEFIVPAASEEALTRLCERASEFPFIRVVEGQARAVLGISEAALVASGTATLEAMLMKCPMVVAYRTDPVSYFVANRMVKTRFFSLVNLVAGEALVQERLQKDASVDTLHSDLVDLLNSKSARIAMVKRFDEIHAKLQRDASNQAARAVVNLMENSGADRGDR